MPITYRRQPTSIVRHHNEWLSLLDISGPFLSMPVLQRAFPQGLEADDPELKRDLRVAYEGWLDNQMGTRPDPAAHRGWVAWVLRHVLDMTDAVLRTDEAALERWAVPVPEHGETMRPDLAIADPSDPTRARLLVQIVPKAQGLEATMAGHAWAASPATRMMELLHATDVVLGLLTNGEQWMLVHAPRGETTGYVSWYADLWLTEPLTLRAFRTFLRLGRFFGVPDDETIEALLRESAAHQEEVTDQLGHQVREAIAILVRTIDRADQDRGGALLAGVPETRLYAAAVTVMMRLVFLLSAEERGLLLLGDPLYDQHYAVSTLRVQLHERADQAGEEVLERHHDAWCRLLATFRAVHAGAWHDELNLPAYGGGLFDPDAYPFLEGRPEGSGWRRAPADPLPIDNRTVLHLLDALQMLQVQAPGGSRGGGAEARRLSFRALDVEQIGHVYEGLLDHTAKRATEPVLGLARAKYKVPDLPLAELEAHRAKGEDDLLTHLVRETGRSRSALRNDLARTPDLETAPRLRAACGNDDALCRRVLPFAGLIREDDYGQPVVVPAGHVYVTAGAERRATGTHYTPRSLTEPIVQHTLEPQVYRGPAEGEPREKWKLRPADELLALKVCDMAMGSGAFLVQACRYLSERLAEAWAEREGNLKRRHPGATILLTPEGRRTDDAAAAIPADPDERLRLARRLVADRCLYGVDKNPLAVEMAKLSLWLVTMEKDKPFTFLDHALKCGDSLVGVSRRQLEDWTLHPDDGAGEGYEPFGTAVEVEKVIALRREIAAMPDNDIRDQQAKAAMLADAEALTNHLRAGADLLVAAYMSDKKGKPWQALKDKLWRAFRQGKDTPPETPDLATVVPGGVRPFHWELEFPEVFDGEAAGFHAVVGNPPFMGGRRVREGLGDRYRDFLYACYEGSSGNADLCAFFFLRSFSVLKRNGTLGLLATNTIAQGDTRETGLACLLDKKATAFRAENDRPWPGQSSVSIDIVYLAKGTWGSMIVLDGNRVDHISSHLDTRRMRGKPWTLRANDGLSHMGSNVVGTGFMMSHESARDLINANPRCAEVLFPYITGEDLNSSPGLAPGRWIINFQDWPLERSTSGSWFGANGKQRTQWLRSGIVPADYPKPVASDYPECLQIVRQAVKPQRETVRREIYRRYWWRFAERQAGLYSAIRPLQWVLAVAQTTKYLAVARLPKGYVYAMMTIVFAFDRWRDFATLASTIHEVWVRANASTLETRLRYTPRDVFETYPFPQPSTGVQAVLETRGGSYDEHRSQTMLDRLEGLTATYNRFHDPQEASDDIARLRALHVEMDHAVAAAYGWDDLDLGHGFHETAQGVRYTIQPAARDEVLDRLLQLNQERYEEEVRAGLHEGKAKGKRQERLL